MRSAARLFWAYIQPARMAGRARTCKCFFFFLSWGEGTSPPPPFH